MPKGVPIQFVPRRRVSRQTPGRHKTTLVWDEEWHWRLVDLANRRHRTMSSLVEEAIREHFPELSRLAE